MGLSSARKTFVGGPRDELEHKAGNCYIFCYMEKIFTVKYVSDRNNSIVSGLIHIFC